MYIVAIYSICLADVSKAVHIIEKNCLFVVYRFSQEFFSHMDTSPRADDLDLFFAPHVRVFSVPNLQIYILLVISPNTADAA